MSEYRALSVELTEGLATVTIDHGKVNAIDAVLSADLHAAISALEENEAVKAVVLAGRPHCFCAGLNVMALAGVDEAGLREFFSTYLHAIQALVRFPKPLVAALTGYAPAGGTIIALTADYRVMGKGEKHTVGMNEFNMSLQIPRMMADVYAHYRGEVAAWADVQSAKMYDSEAALSHGLVDESVAVDEVLSRAKAHARRLMLVHPPVFSRTKAYLRRNLLAAVDADIDARVDVIAQNLSDPKFREMMAAFVAHLKK